MAVVGGPSPIDRSSNGDAGTASLTAIGGVPYLAWDETDGTNSPGAGEPLERGPRRRGRRSWAAPASTRPATYAPSLTAIGGVPMSPGRRHDGADSAAGRARVHLAERPRLRDRSDAHGPHAHLRHALPGRLRVRAGARRPTADDPRQPAATTSPSPGSSAASPLNQLPLSGPSQPRRPPQGCSARPLRSRPRGHAPRRRWGREGPWPKRFVTLRLAAAGSGPRDPSPSALSTPTPFR